MKDRSSTSNLLECLVNHIRMLEVIIGEEIKLVKEVADINATQGVHL